MSEIYFGLFHVEPTNIQECNPLPHLSCGACCGLYDFEDTSCEHLEQILHMRTQEYRGVMKDIRLDAKDFTELQIRMNSLIQLLTNQEKKERLKPQKDDPCVFLRFILEDPQLVGCLLHPLQNKEVDLRYFGRYSQPVCASYSCGHSDEAIDLALRCRDWYDYGLEMSRLEEL